MSLELDTNVALKAAELAATCAEDVIKRYLSSGDWSVSMKSDDTPVTEVDVEVETVIRRVLSEAVPDAGFFGEETGYSDDADDARCLWLVDPIDGTKSFIRGLPFYSSQIALQVDRSLILGVSNAPAYAERLVAISDQGAWLNDNMVAVRSDVTTIDNAYLSTGNLTSLAQDADAWSRFGQVVSRAQRVRGYGDFCHYHQLCCGQADLIIESDVNILDIAALSVAVTAAGGIITDLNGSAIDLATTSVLAAGSAALHEQALDMLHES